MNGIELVIESTQLENKIKNSDLVITGEGKIDSQTSYGKTIKGISRLSKKYSVPVIAFCGQIGAGAEDLLSQGIHDIIPITRRTDSLDYSMKNAGHLLEKTTVETMRDYNI